MDPALPSAPRPTQDERYLSNLARLRPLQGPLLVFGFALTLVGAAITIVETFVFENNGNAGLGFLPAGIFAMLYARLIRDTTRFIDRNRQRLP